MSLFPQGEAQFSSDMVYRFRLTRELGQPAKVYDAQLDEWRYREALRVLVFIMLNPSTADADKDDPTIRRCKSFGKLWGYHKVVIGNLYGYRATEPKEMWRAALAGTDIVGEDNNSALVRAIMEASGYPPHLPRTPSMTKGAVVCAWGQASSLPKALRDQHQQRAAFVRRLIGSQAYALRLNDDGSPVHPLYQPDDIKPIAWPEAA
jgi:hypothetical protein